MGKIIENYGELVFGQEEMKKRLTSETFDQYMDTINFQSECFNHK